MIPRNQIHFAIARPQHTSPTVRVIKAFVHSGERYKVGDKFPFQKLGVRDDQLRGLWASELIALDSERAA